ncbi:MAG: MFS transporter [Bacilli bacterium]
MDNVNKMPKEKVGFRNWISFIIIGLAGQFAWMIENMYLNKFIFSFGSNNYTSMISITVALSAITAAVTTIFMGSLSDKIGKRKIFICLGYILWGIATASFGFIKRNTNLDAVSCSVFVIILDCVMTFFGSTANDACFNSYVTKNVSTKNRGKVEGVLSILPLMAMLVIFVGLDRFTSKDSSGETHWDIFFFIIGAIVLLVGIASFFLLPKEKVDKNDEKYLSLLADGFKPKTIKTNKILYLVLIAYLIYGIATQVFFPYLTIYFQYSLNFDANTMPIILGIVLIVGSALSVVAGYLMDKFGKLKTLIPICIVAFVGFFILFFVPKENLIFTIIAGVIMMFGYVSVSAILNAILRDYIPKGKEGVFMGVRMLFVVMLPMCTGPFIGQAITDNLATSTYTDPTYGTIQNLPPNYIWLVGSLIFLLIFIPIIFIIKEEKKKRIVKEDNDTKYEN